MDVDVKRAVSKGKSILKMRWELLWGPRVQDRDSRLHPGGSSQRSTSSATQGSGGVGGGTEKGTSVLSQFRKALAFELDFEDLGGACWMEHGIKNVLKPVKAGSGSAVGSGSWCRPGWRASVGPCTLFNDFGLFTGMNGECWKAFTQPGLS